MSDTKELLKKLEIDREHPIERTKQSKWMIALLLVIAGLLVWVLLWNWEQGSEYKNISTDKKNLEQAPVVPDSVTSKKYKGVQKKDGSQTDEQQKIASGNSVEKKGLVLSASGYIVARRIATVSAKITGRIAEVLVEEGLRVTKGQVLARLDNTKIKLLLDAIIARRVVEYSRIDSITAQLDEAQRVFKRQQSLRKKGFSNEASLTRLNSNVKRLQADLSGAQANLLVMDVEMKQREEDLEDTVIRAPFDGVVVEKAAQLGEIISPMSAGGGFTRTGICTVVDMSSQEIEVDVNESYISRVFNGQRVVARLDAYPNQSFDAKVITIVPTANRSKATVKVRVSIGFPTEKIEEKTVYDNILPNMGVKVNFYE